MTGLQFINLIQPKHGRTSCSDDDINNGFFTYDGEHWNGRCTRCMYLQIINGCPLPDGFDVDEL